MMRFISVLADRQGLPPSVATEELMRNFRDNNRSAKHKHLPSEPGREPINNSMTYNDNECCMTAFTMEQILLMQANILSYPPFWLK